MDISATARNRQPAPEVVVRTGAARQTLAVPLKPAGKGLAVSGGEFLMLVLATCFCNDLYREAEHLRIPLEALEVEASARFPGVGLAATDIRYRAKISSPAPASAIAELLRQTDAVSEVHNTLRAGAKVELSPWTRD